MATNGTSIYGIPSTDAKLLSSFFVNVGLFVVMVSWFLFFKKRVPRVYESRVFERGDVAGSPEPGLLGWVRSAFRHDMYWILKHRGLETVVYLKTLQYLIVAMAPCTFLAVVVLMPLYNVLGGRNLPGLDSVTLINCNPGPVLWAPFTLCVVFSLWIILILYLLYREVTKLRILFRSLKRPENYVAMVHELPRTLSAKQLGDHFDALLGHKNSFSSLVVCLKSNSLPRLFRQRERAIRQVEKFMATPAVERVFRCFPYSPLRALCCQRGRVDGIEYWQAELARLDELIAEKQTKNRRGAGVAFVSFPSIRTAQFFWQSELHSGRFTGKFVPSPWMVDAPAPPESIAFENMHVTATQRFWRIVVVDIVNIILICALYVPVVIFVAIANVDDLGTVPILGSLVAAIPASEGFVRGFLPSLGLAICNLIFEGLLNILVKQIRFLDYGLIHKSILGRFFIFFIVNNLIGITVGGSILTVFQILSTGNIPELFSIIAVSIPKQAMFFQNYVLLLAVGGNAYYLAKPLYVVWRYFVLRCFWHSKRSRREQDGPWWFRFESAIWPLVVFLFSMVYGVISPLILVFGLTYMCLAYVRDRYDLVYVFTTLHPSNGFIFPVFFTVCVWSTIIFQIVTMIVLVLYELFLAPLLLIVIAFSIAVFVLVQIKFSSIAKFGTLSQAPEVPGVIVPPDAYTQPYFMPPKMQVETQNDFNIEPEEAEPEWEHFDVAQEYEPEFEEEDEGLDKQLRFSSKEDAQLIKPVLPINSSNSNVNNNNINNINSSPPSIEIGVQDDPKSQPPAVRTPRSPRIRQESTMILDDLRAPRSPRSPRLYSENSLIVDDPRARTAPEIPSPLRPRGVTSFYVVSPAAARKDGRMNTPPMNRAQASLLQSLEEGSAESFGSSTVSFDEEDVEAFWNAQL